MKDHDAFRQTTYQVQYVCWFKRNKSPAYIVSKTDDINSKICGRVKIGLAGKQIPFAGTDPDR